MTRPDVAQQDSEQTFDRLVDEGEQRLGRTWTGLSATALLGGIDIGAGAIALLVVEHETHSVVLGGLAFSLGFIALTLAHSELFTEGFLIPVAAVVAKKSTVLALLRLWGMSIVGNLAGGWLIMRIAMTAFPDLHRVAVEAGSFYLGLGTTWRAFALAVIGGFVITLMTHMQHSTDSEGVRLVPAVAMGFLLGAGKLNHAIVASLLSFAALQVGVPFGYGDWVQLFLLSVAGNMTGGLGLVTVLRLLQVPHKLAAERDANDGPQERRDTEPEA